MDGGRSTSSSKPVSASGRKAVSMGSFRKPSSGSSAKSAGQTLTRRSAVSGYRASRCSTSRRRTLVFATLKSFLIVSSGKDAASAGAVDEEDFLRAFEDVPTVQVLAHAHRHTQSHSHTHRFTPTHTQSQWQTVTNMLRDTFSIAGYAQILILV